ncbi:DUF4238 domain-containing protein [Pseudomonas helmanticensis]|uniref:DUF4238 domain-containing protein n=1 Tax=Pseudomonas helmanticensis TaxID=1471381 RepID=UPI0038155978
MQPKQNPAKKHHYIPEFYQKGFCQPNGQTWRYRKDYNKIQEKYPSAILYELDLHTVSIRSKTTTMIETFYSGLEGQFAQYLAFIHSNTMNPAILSKLKNDANFIKILKYIIAFQHWRVPCNTIKAKNLSEKLLSLYDNAETQTKELLKFDRKFIKLIQKKSKKPQALKIAQYLLLPILTFKHNLPLNNMRFFSIPNKEKTIFTSDKPISFDSEEMLFSFEEFAFPISKDLFIISTKNIAKRVDIKKLNSLIFSKSINYVISDNKERLQHEIKAPLATISNIADCVIEFEEPDTQRPEPPDRKKLPPNNYQLKDH